MPKPPYPIFSVKDFGPIREGQVALKPLTVFIGPNNSGKSYMALLIYAIAKALSDPVRRPLFGLGPPSWIGKSTWEDSVKLEVQEKYHKLPQWLAGLRKKTVTLRELPEEISGDSVAAVQRSAPWLADEVLGAVRASFGVDDPAVLRRSSATETACSVGVAGSRPRGVFLDLAFGHAHPKVGWTLGDVAATALSSDALEELHYEPWRAREVLVAFSWREMLRQRGMAHGNVHYLPPARSGVLRNSQVLASMAVAVVRSRALLDPIQLPAFSGVDGDFLHQLLERVLGNPSRRQHPAMEPALEILEGSIFQGAIFVQQPGLGPPGLGQPLLAYHTGALDIPLQRASSMVAELAPLDLWIRHLLQPGDLLVIDEPEAHLHPENQRRIARTLVRLARAGVHVICPTHSSIILHQISNHLLATEATPADRRASGFTADDLLEPDDVGVYLYDLGEDGAVIKPVSIEPGFGISEDEFVRVDEALGDETYRLTPPPKIR